MRTRRYGFTALLGATLFVGAWSAVLSQQNAPTAMAELGKPAPAFTLTSPQGKTYSLDRERKDAKAVVAMFISTQCPVSNAYNERMAQLAQDYASKGVRFLGINANCQESVEEVGAHAKEHKFPFPVLIDVGNATADVYQAKVTPHVYLIDGQGILRYRGRIDDSQDPAQAKSQDLRTALDAVLAGKPVPTDDTRAFGCSIKRMPKEQQE